MMLLRSAISEAAGIEKGTSSIAYLRNRNEISRLCPQIILTNVHLFDQQTFTGYLIHVRHFATWD